MNLSLRLATFLALAGSAFSQQQDSSFRLDAEIENDLPKLSWDTEREKTYFMTFSPDLRTWTYIPEVMPGFGGKDFLYAGTNRDQMFYRLHRSEVPTIDLYSADHDGDGVPSFAELTLIMTDPLKADTNGNGQSDRMLFPPTTGGIYTDQNNHVRYLITDSRPGSNSPGGITAIPFNDTTEVTVSIRAGEKSYESDQVADDLGFVEFDSNLPLARTGARYARKVEWLTYDRALDTGNNQFGFFPITTNHFYPNDPNQQWRAGYNIFVGGLWTTAMLANQNSVRDQTFDLQTGEISYSTNGGPFGVSVQQDRGKSIEAWHPEYPTAYSWVQNRWQHAEPGYRWTTVFDDARGHFVYSGIDPIHYDWPPFGPHNDPWEYDFFYSSPYRGRIVLHQRLYDEIPETTNEPTLERIREDRPTLTATQSTTAELYGLWQITPGMSEGDKIVTYRRFQFQFRGSSHGIENEPIAADVFFRASNDDEPEVVMTAQWDGQGTTSQWFTVDPIELRPGQEGIYYLNTTTVAFEPVSNQAFDRRSGQEPVVLAPDPTGYDPQQPTLTETVTRHPSRLSFVGVPDEDFLTGRVIVQILGNSSGDIRIIAKDPVSGDQVQVPLGQDVSNLFFSSRGPYHDYDWFLEGAAEGSVEVGAILRRGGGKPSLTVTRTMRVMPPLEILTESNGQTVTAPRVVVTSRAPRVELDPIQASSVVVNGSQGSVTISGWIYDDLMDAIPAGSGADVQSVEISVDNQSPFTVVPVQRQSYFGPTVWKPYRARGRIPPTVVNFLVSDSNEIRVTSSPNLVGQTGTDLVVFRWDITKVPGSFTGAQDRTVEMRFPASTVSNRRDQVILSPIGFAGASQTLLETGNNTLEFVGATGSSVKLIGNYTAQASRSSVWADVFTNGYGEYQVPLTGHVKYTETGETTNRFTVAHGKPANFANLAYSYSLREVENVVTKTVGSSMPFTLGARSLEGACVALGGSVAGITKTSLAGRQVPAWLSNRPVIFFVAKGNEGRELVYYDEGASVLRRVPINATASVFQAAIRADGDSSQDLDVTQKGIWDLSFVDDDGQEVLPPLPVDAQTLIEVANGELPPEVLEGRAATISASAMNPDTVIKVRSAEIDTDFFALAVEGSNAANGYLRRATMRQVALGKYLSNQKVVVYSSTESITTINATTWNRLKNRGFIAVHNTIPELDVSLQGVGVANEFGYADRQDHHVFPKFASNRPHNPNAKPTKYSGVLNKIMGEDFDVDLYTISLTADDHKLTQSAPPNGLSNHSKEWQRFFDNYIDDDGNLLNPNTDQAKKDLINKMYELHDDPRLNQFDTMRPYSEGSWGEGRLIKNKAEYRAKWFNPGSARDEMLKLDSIVGKLDFRKRDARNKAWKGVASKLGKGGVKAIKKAGLLGAVVTAYASAQALANGEHPEQVIVDAIFDGGLSREVAREFLEGNARIGFDIPFVNLSDFEVVTFVNGKTLYRGENIAFVSFKSDGSVADIKYGELRKITAGDNEFEVKLLIKDPDRENERKEYVKDVRHAFPCVDDFR